MEGASVDGEHQHDWQAPGCKGEAEGDYPQLSGEGMETCWHPPWPNVSKFKVKPLFSLPRPHFVRDPPLRLLSNSDITPLGLRALLTVFPHPHSQQNPCKPSIIPWVCPFPNSLVISLL